MQESIKKVISEELASTLSSKGFSEDDVRVVITSIDIYPSAGREIVKNLVIVKLHEDKPISREEESLDKFAERHGLVPEALFIIYLNREKYKKLSEDDLTRARSLVSDILRDAIGGKIEEVPETS